MGDKLWWVIAQIPHTVLVRDVDCQTDARREKIQKEFKRHIWRNCAGEASRMRKVLLFRWFGFHRNVCVLWLTHILLNTFSSVREGRSLSFLNLFFTRDRNITRAILDDNYLDCITTQLQWPDLNANMLTLSLRFYALHVLFPHIIHQNSQKESITVTVHMLHRTSELQSLIIK